MSVYVFPDNTVLCNFACVSRVGLLVDHLRGRGRWVEAVADEAKQSSAYLPDLASLVGNASPLGEPIRFEDIDEGKAIDRLRRVVFGGVRAEPRRHLGEAQTCHLLLTHPEWAGSTWITDDGDAYRYARQQGIITRGTVDVFREIIADGDLTAHAAHEQLLAIDELRPGLPIPPRPTDLM